MNKFSSLLFFYAFALVCTVMWLMPSCVVSAPSQEATSLTFPAINGQEQPYSYSPFVLPNRSDIISTLLNNHRNLRAEARFSSLNQIFNQVSIKLPDAKLSKSGLDIIITQIECHNLNVQDIQLSHNVESSTSQRIDVSVEGLKTNCNFRWEYKWSFFNGSGSGTADLDPSSFAKFSLQFLSENYDTHPPHDVNVKDCNPVIKIKDLDFDGDGLGIIGGLLSSLKDMLMDTVQGELVATVCTVLQELGEGIFDDLLLTLSRKMGTYLGPLEASLANPLFLENTIQAPMTDNGEDIAESLYLNFQKMEDYAGEWMNSAFDQVGSFMGPSDFEPSGELGINNFIRDNFLNDNGKITVDPLLVSRSGVIFESHDMLTQTSMSIKSIQIEGLDSFKEVDLLNVIGKHTLQNKLKLDHLHIVAEMEAEMKASTLEGAMIVANDSDPIKEKFTIDVSASGVEVDTSVFLGINTETFGNMRLGSILHFQNILPCLLTAVDDAKFTGLSVSVSGMSPPKLSGFIDSGFDHLMSMGAASLFEMFEKVLIKAMPNFFEMYVRDMVNEFVDNTLHDVSCSDPGSSLGGILDFRDLLLSEEQALELLGQGDSPYGDLFRFLYNFLEDMMSENDENGLSRMNVLLASLTKHQSNKEGDLYHPGDLIRQDLDLTLNGLNAAIELGVSDVRVANIDSLGGPIALLQPVKGESSVLNNTASIGVGSEPFRAEFRLSIKGEGDKVEVHNELVLGLSLENVGMMLELLMQVAEPSFLEFPLRDVLNIQCWLATVAAPVLDKYGIRVRVPDSGIVLKNLALAIAEARLSIECISCSSPLIVEMSSKLGSQEAVEDTTAVANRILDYLSNLLLGGGFIQSGLDKMLNEAAMKCPHSPSYNRNFQGLKYDALVAPEKNEDSYGFLIAIIAVIAGSLVFASVIFVTTRCVSRHRHNSWVKTLNRTQKLELERVQNDERKREKNLNGRMSSLVRSKEVPLFLRLSIPMVIIGNIALFLSGHLSLGGTVNISGSFAGQEFDVQGFFEFSMAKSTIEMWNAGATVLAILIVIFSGVWPYTKLLITLFIWFAPPSWLSSNRRGKLLHWLDVLGKWSMVDVFVLLMTLASFRLSVENPNHLNFLPDGLYSIKMFVVPLWGLYANMLAQFVAQILSHIIIHYHRKTIMAATHSQEVEWNSAPSNLDNAKEKLGSHMFKLDYEVSSKHAIVRSITHWVLSAALLLFVILLVCGCALPSFGIEVLGLVGLVVESGNQFEQAKDLYSIFDLATMIMDQARYHNTAADLVGLGTLASLLVITVFLVPLAQVLSLCAQWFAPMAKREQVWNTVLNEILGAWQYMEVYVLSIIIAAWQLGGVSEYMINAYCGSLESTFASLAYYGILTKDDAQCFRVDATVQSASWILVAASFILCFLNHFIVGASLQKEQDNDIPAERRLHSDRWLPSKQSTVTIHGDISMSMNSDEEEGYGLSDTREVCVLPVKPRFTDYYCFATTYRNEE